MSTAQTIIEVSDVTKSYTSPDGSPLHVLDGISFELREGEIVALLGRSGSGKSTLLRCIAGLIAPSSGAVSYRGAVLNGANPGVAMVFQSFALLPWLTVRQNVELGLEARAVPPGERRRRAEQAIDRIGLDGFESAYPKELSGGMRQRVGFARALVVEPDALLMDEPFSALDVLTAQNLRTELLHLWAGHDFPTKAVLIVTHNIEEAVTLADRIFVLGSNPGRIRSEVQVPMPQPRDRNEARFQELVDEIYDIMTGPDQRVPSHVADTSTSVAERSPVESPLPEVTVGGMSGLIEILAGRGGREISPTSPICSASKWTTCSLCSTLRRCSASPQCTAPTSSSPRRAESSMRPISTPLSTFLPTRPESVHRSCGRSWAPSPAAPTGR